MSRVFFQIAKFYFGGLGKSNFLPLNYFYRKNASFLDESDIELKYNKILSHNFEKQKSYNHFKSRLNFDILARFWDTQSVFLIAPN